jgi:hypothetical protein
MFLYFHKYGNISSAVSAEKIQQGLQRRKSPARQGGCVYLGEGKSHGVKRSSQAVINKMLTELAVF